MKQFALIILVAVFALTVFGQKPKPTPNKVSRPTPKPEKTVVPKLGTVAEEFEKAKSIQDASERIKAFGIFIGNFPDAAETNLAKSWISSSRAILAEQRLEANDIPSALALFALSINDAPNPVPDELFSKVIIRFPLSLKTRNQVGPAFDIAKLIEEKVGENAPQLLDLAKFYISAQYGTEAIRLAEKSVAIDPSKSVAYETLANAFRMNYRLEDAAAALSKSLEIDPSAPLRHNLAAIKRALGKPEEALALYRETLAASPDDTGARTGMILALFESGKRGEAELILKSQLEKTPNESSLLTGVAYWYASAGDAERAGIFSKMALSADPSNTWAYIAEARALMLDKKPLDAERVLLSARQFGNLPTLDYEIATARFAAGFYREAAEMLKQNFVVNKEGLIETYLGNRILADAPSFTELLSLERRAAIFNRDAADDASAAQKLKALLDLYQKLEKDDTPEAELLKSVDEFVAGTDNSRLHRQLYAANRLLRKKSSPTKVLDLMQSAVTGVEAALNVPSPSAAVLADELYDSRQYFIARSQVVSVNEIPRAKLLSILRGRIEETAGWAYLSQENGPQAIIRFKRALTVLPEKSTWWRSTWRRLGAAYLADGKEPEALEAYIKAYDTDQPDKVERTALASLWTKVKGTIDGLDARIGQDPFAETVAVLEPSPVPTPNVRLPQDLPLSTPVSVPTATPTPNATPELPKTPETPPTPVVETTPVPSPTVEPEVTPLPSPTVEPTATPLASPTVEPTVTPLASLTVEPTITPLASPTVEPTATPLASPTVEPTVTPLASPTVEPTVTPLASPIVEPTATPSASPTVEPTAAPSASPTVEASATPTPSANPKPLFDPIIITVGRADQPKTGPSITPTPTPEASPEKIPEPTPNATPEKSPEPTPEASPEKTPEPTPSATPELKAEPTPEKTPEPTPGATPVPSPDTVADNRPLDASGETRPRIVPRNISPCTIVVSQDMISVIGGGGNMGILVGFDDETNDPGEIVAESRSPGDVQVIVDRNIGFSSRRAFFIIKSVSEKTGAFTITFQAPCGKKEIQVKVR